MTDATESQDWVIISRLQPQLRRHVRIYPQVYRGQRWYVLRDESDGRHLRFTASAYEFIARLDGSLSVESAWQKACTALGGEGLSQDEVIILLHQLFAIDVLRSDLPADARAFFSRFQNDRSMRRLRMIMNPLAIRVPLLDPDVLLNRLIPWVRPLFSKGGALIWFLVMAFASLLLLANVSMISTALDKNILSPDNFLMMLLVFIIIKIVHEFGHAFAVKMWGGEVHEMGITLLVLAPVPYVDASAAWGFRDKYKRVLVGAVGILAELFLAALGLLVWLTVEPGLIKDAALNAFFVGSVSTLLFNANPLLRFDGYYVLQDLIEIPNLATRASRYYLYLIQRYLFGLKQLCSPVTGKGEAVWFSIYGLAAFFYRLIILVLIVLFLIEEYLVVGVVLGIWAATTQLILPLFRALRFLLLGNALNGRRLRATLASLLLLGGGSAVLIFLPVSQTTSVEGVVWVSDQAQVYAGAEGVVAEQLVASGTPVEVGTPIIQMRAFSLDSRIAKLEARRRELSIRSAADRVERRLQSAMVDEEVAVVEAELALLREQKSALLVRSRAAGIFVMANDQRFKGQYLLQGALIGYVFSRQNLIIRAVIPQSEIGLVRQQVNHVEVRFAERLDEVLEVSVIRQKPSASTTLPSRALGAAGGGDIAVRMNSKNGLTAAEKVFQVDLGLPDDFDVTGVGERAYVRFDHGAEPLAGQWLRSGRQLLLSRLSF
ncbi:hypothetical protein [Amphritea sp. HPY]|uniref:hypothetical protein n=1 Tax=Amphritea sp. HPY TaxID=3421652 RepID=UPI003D7F0A73